MKQISKFLLFFILIINSSCKSQENLNLDYEARTRGYHYKLTLNEKLLSISTNGDKKEVVLSASQLNSINQILDDIDFSKIKNNTSTDNFAVDASIPVSMNIFYNKKEYNYTFDSENLPEKIKQLMAKLDEFTKM